MYCIWIPGTLLGKINSPDDVQRLTISHRASHATGVATGSSHTENKEHQDSRKSEVELSSGTAVATKATGVDEIKNPITIADRGIENDTVDVNVDV